jgi:DNA-binding transcriptional MerR regulator
MSVPHPDDARAVPAFGARAVDPARSPGGGGGATGAARDDVVEARLDAPDAALAAAAADDDVAPFDLDGLLAATGATPALLAAVERTGLLAPHHVDEVGTPRYSAADVAAVRAGMTLLDAGLPLGELLDLARRTDRAIQEIADHAIEAFLRFVRDPVRGTASSDEEAANRLVTAYEEMLPATERLVAHHLRRLLLTRAAERVAVELGEVSGQTGDPPDAAGPGDPVGGVPS